jgi:hypothetical protein
VHLPAKLAHQLQLSTNSAICYTSLILLLTSKFKGLIKKSFHLFTIKFSIASLSRVDYLIALISSYPTTFQFVQIRMSATRVSSFRAQFLCIFVLVIIVKNATLTKIIFAIHFTNAAINYLFIIKALTIQIAPTCICCTFTT